jgi:threonine/homoserine/homoserine lactone efflux protein
MTPFIEGIILGLTLAVLLGPAMFALVQTSIHRGFRSGMQLAFGIFLSDVTLVFLCIIGAMQIVSGDKSRMTFGVIAGMILIGYGVFTFVRQTAFQRNGINDMGDPPGWVTYLLKGFFLNIANPFVWLFWMGVTVGITSSYGDDTGYVTTFFAGALFTVLLTDLLKAFIAKKIKHFLTPQIIHRMNQLVGILLFFFGVVLIVRSVLWNI